MKPNLGSITIIVVATVASVGLVASSAPAQEPPPTTARPPAAAPESLLAVLDAAGGHSSGGTVTLTGIDSRAVWFADRPARRAGTYRIPELLRTFFEGQTPPNAALEFSGATKRNDVTIVELSKPRFDKAAHRLRFAVRVVGDPGAELGGSTALGDFVARNDGRLPKMFDAVSVFIDSASSPYCDANLQNGFGGSVTQLQNVTCAEAQSVVAQTYLTVVGDGIGCDTAAGWNCTLSNDRLPITLSSGSKSLVFGPGGGGGPCAATSSDGYQGTIGALQSVTCPTAQSVVGGASIAAGGTGVCFSSSSDWTCDVGEGDSNVAFSGPGQFTFTISKRP